MLGAILWFLAGLLIGTPLALYVLFRWGGKKTP